MKQVALLRGINVSGKNKIRMADLKALFESLGCDSVSTYLQSGNVVFESTRSLPAKEIEKAIDDQMGLEVPVLTFPASSLKFIDKKNPFLIKGEADPGHCYVTFLWETPSEQSVSSIAIPNKETGSFSMGEDIIYVHCPDGYGRTKIHTGFFEKKLNQFATTRNWKTIQALLDLSS